MDELTFEARPFSPPAWAGGPHVQTLGARALRPAGGPTYTRERWETPDGDFLDLDWTPEVGPDAPIVLVLHGLEGSTARRYVRNVCAELARRGVRAAAMNFRGCSGEPNRLPRFYHSGDSADPRWVLDRIAERYPGRRLGGFGFSLGGNILLKLLGEDGAAGERRLSAAVAMSVPYDLAAGCRLLEQSRMGRFYTWYFLKSLRAKAAVKAEALEPLLDLDAAMRAPTIWAWDDAATAPLHGFGSAAAYYAACSSNSFLPSIQVPTLLQHAADDPFLPPNAIPRSAAAANPALHLSLHERGGHVAFLDGSLRSPRFWGDEEGARFLAEQLGA